jgi:hypothetical protein
MAGADAGRTRRARDDAVPEGTGEMGTIPITSRGPYAQSAVINNTHW